MEIQDIEKVLQDLPDKMEKKSEEVINSREEWLKKKAEYEYRYQHITLAYKAKDDKLTQTDLKANATIGSHQERLDMIVAESKYKKTQKELQRLRDDFDSAKEQSYNHRATLRRFN